MRILRHGLALKALLVLAGSAFGQEKEIEPPPPDPYTGGDAEIMAQAGYKSFGGFPWADGHTTYRIEKALGGEPILWVETRHFKIGSSLAPYTIPKNRAEREKIRDELERLKEKIPAIKPKVRELDAWLRLHLFAQRAEDQYAEVCDWLGVEDEDFPAKAGRLVNGEDMGLGPYLGQPGKFLILLFGKTSSYARYQEAFLGGASRTALRHNFNAAGSLMFATAVELDRDTLGRDTGLHCQLVFGLTQSLFDGYRFYRFNLPIWLKEGLGHWFGRRLDPKFNNFSHPDETGGDMRASWKWEPRVRQRVKHKYFPTTRDFLEWDSYDDLKFSDHMVIWSRVDYLMSLGKEPFAVFMRRMKAPIDNEHKIPSLAQVNAQLVAAMQAAWDLDPEGLDAAWAKWVLKKYPAK